MQTTRQKSRNLQKLGTSWRTIRGLTCLPSFLPPSLPPKSSLVDYAQFPDVCSTEEASTRFSAFLFAKLIPKEQSPDELLHGYAHKLSRPPLNNTEYTSALDNYLLPTFRSGWDKGYEGEVTRGILSNGKTVEGIHASEWDLDVADFRSMCLGTSPLPPVPRSDIKLHTALAIPDSGKLRLVTLGSKIQHLLAPLHRLIYGILTRKGTTLRGPPLPSTFSSFPSSSDPLCSGDYEASTDNLSSSHARHLLLTLRSRSRFIPPQIWDLALASLQGTVTYQTSDGTSHCFEQTTGQLMGNYLSFPLLCISNIATLFLAFGSEEAWRMVNNRLVVVNGDDIVFKASRPKIALWRSRLPMSGFVINDIKTSVHSTLFTLNSKLFRCGGRRVRKVWHLVPKGLFSKTDITKHRDVMAAHAAIVRENVRGIPGKLRVRTSRALASIKKQAYERSSVKTLAGIEEREYLSWPQRWKVAERLVAWEVNHVPLKERHDGARLEKIERVWATEEEIAESPIVAAEARFNLLSRPKVVESNDRYISAWDWEQAHFFCFQKWPRYEKRREEWVWLREGRSRHDDMEFVPYHSGA